MISPQYGNRRIEWFAAQAMVAIGIHSAVKPEAFATSRMAPILDLVGPWTLCSIYIAGSICRLVGLYFNLGWYGCQMRAAGALIGLCLWLQMGYALAISSLEFDVPVSTQIWIYVLFAYHEGRSIKRATDDARLSIANGASDAIAA